MKDKLKEFLCKNNFHNWVYSCGMYSRECKFCGKHQITIGEMGAIIYDYFKTNISGKFDIINDDKIKITYLPHCINVPSYVKNPYIGIEGIVKDFDGKRFNLFTGHSWICGIELKKCRFQKLNNPFL
jgi:hypothetical protein